MVAELTPNFEFIPDRSANYSRNCGSLLKVCQGLLCRFVTTSKPNSVVINTPLCRLPTHGHAQVPWHHFVQGP